MAVLGFIFLMIGCGSPCPKVINDLSDASYQLVNQDSQKVNFPTDFKGQSIITGYIFTNCNGVCPAITANMKKISKKLDDNREVQFVGISFDPMRDNPEALKQYMKKFELDNSRFTYLTGDSAEVYALLDRIGIRTKMVPDTNKGGLDDYSFNHTNQINLFDSQGRIRGKYGGSMTPPEMIIEDLDKLE
jgi:protein SCO1/2